MRKIQFFDTTLRDGEQTPGVHFNVKEKIQIVLQLEKWGVAVIEASFPIASPGDFEAVQSLACQIKKLLPVWQVARKKTLLAPMKR